MNKLKAWFIAKEGLKVLAIDKFFILEIFLIVGFIFIFTRITFKIINYRVFKTSLIVGFYYKNYVLSN